MVVSEVTVHLRAPHPRQAEFVNCPAKRIIVRAGRRGGKTTGVAIRIVQKFLQGRRQSYGVPTSEQLTKCWFEICNALREPIEAGVFKKNETEHVIEKPGTEQRIKLRTVWNADTMRGDWGDDIYFDEWQLMDEDAWEVVGAPMLMDNDGTATFIYTPPSLRSAGISKAHDPRHAAKMFRAAGEDGSGRWARFHFTSYDNPYLSHEGLAEAAKDMSQTAIRQELLAEDDELNASHLVYGVWDEKRNKTPRFEIPVSWPVFAGQDFGTANPAALFWARAQLPIPRDAPVMMRQGDLVVFSEYLPGAGQSTALNVQAFQGITKDRTVKGIAGGSHQEEETREAYRRHGWNIQEPPIVGLRPQVDRVLATMEASKWWVFEDCIFYLAELACCAWKYDKDGNKTNEIDGEARFHLCACARYGLSLSDFTPETVVRSDKPKLQVLRF